MADTTPSWLSDRAVLRVAGDDVRGFLQGLVTQDLATVTPETPRWAALLTPQGKALFDFILWADSDAVLVDCEASQTEALAKRLTLYRLRRAITIEPADGVVHWSPDGEQGIPDPRNPELGRRWLAPAGAPAAGWLEHRLHLGVTEGVAELGSGETLWLECNAAELNGVIFTKGCYVGQENTARMNWRQKVNRRLAVVPLAQSDPARQRAAYPELGLAVDHLRVEAITHPPHWLAEALQGDAG